MKFILLFVLFLGVSYSQELPKQKGVEVVGNFPEAVHRPGPLYPAYLYNQGIGGTVFFSVMVDATGSVVKLLPLNSPYYPTHPRLIQEAEKALRQWKYKPFKINGVPTPFQFRIGIKFTQIGRAHV